MELSDLVLETTLGKSYMLYGMTSDPSERGNSETGKNTREAYAIDNILFMAWSAINSREHDVVVYSPQYSNYKILHGMKLNRARKVAKDFAREKVEMLQKIAEDNNLDVNVYDSDSEMRLTKFQDIFNYLLDLREKNHEIRDEFVKLVPDWISEKVNWDFKKRLQLAEYGIREVAYIIFKAQETKIGHFKEKVYDELSLKLIRGGLVNGFVVPTFYYPYSGGSRLGSDLPIDPYIVPNNPGARNDRILISDTPEMVKCKINNVLERRKYRSVKNYLEIINEISEMVNPKPGTIMDWLPEIFSEYLKRIDIGQKETI